MPFLESRFVLVRLEKLRSIKGNLSPEKEDMEGVLFQQQQQQQISY